MPPFKTALALVAAAALNGSVAQAMTAPSCIPALCVLPLDGAPLHRARLVLDLEAGPEAEDEPARDATAPPRRPLDLTAPRLSAPEARPEPGEDRASFAPPRRPAGLGGAR